MGLWTGPAAGLTPFPSSVKRGLVPRVKVRPPVGKSPPKRSLDGAPSRELCYSAISYFSDAISITKRYFTSLFASRSKAWLMS
jgi:hypothetical protein